MVGENETKKGTITVKGNKVGSTTITLTIDGATFDEEDLSGQTMKINVNVVAKPKPKPNTNTNTNTNKPTNNNKPTNSNTNTNNNLSKNNNLKNISVEGHTLTKIDDEHYSLSVSNNVTSVNVNATAEDAKATVTGTGKKELKAGTNTIEITITSESGDKRKITLTITRKENFTMEDVDDLLDSSQNTPIDIVIKEDTVIPATVIQKIKEKKKLVNFSYQNEEGKLLYRWIINGQEIDEPKDILITVDYNKENKKEISKASNYAEGLVVNFKQKGEMPKGVKVQLYVKDIFEDGYVLKLYQYENGELKKLKEDINVLEGYIDFPVEKGNDYLVTMSDIGPKEETTPEKKNEKLNVFMIVSIVELVIIIILLIVLLKKKRSKKETKIEEQKVVSPVEELEQDDRRNDVWTL